VLVASSDAPRKAIDFLSLGWANVGIGALLTEVAMQKLGLAWSVLGVSSLWLALCACGASQEAAPPPATPAAEGAPAPTDSASSKTIEVAFQPKSGSQLSGKATLTETSEGVKVALALEGLPPGEHGAHVHEKGDCSAPDGASAGGHFNPASNPHALPTGTPRHLGDLGNISISPDGKGTLEIVAAGANLKDGDPNSFVGRAIIVHEKQDDGGQPTGNAGGRIGCAEIK
jgi:superoxide dismutase, Cu-Zn family